MSFIILGLIVGIISGVIGIGGGIFIVPSLVYFFNFSQHQAQGTTLALLIPPIGILAALTYFKQGHVNIKVAILIAAGFFIGGLIGAIFANSISSPILQKIFAVFTILIGLFMLFK